MIRFEGGNALSNALALTAADLDCAMPRRPGQTLVGTAAAETLEGGRGDDTIDGNGGADTMLGGAGHDSLIWDPGDGSDVIDGGAGFDTHVFNTSNAAEELALFAEGKHAILTRNLGTIRMDIDNVERVVIGGGGGADRVVIGDLSRTDVRQVAVDLRGSVGADGNGTGDGAADVVAVSGDAGADRVRLGLSAGGVVTIDGLGVALSVTQAEAADRVEIDGKEGLDVVAIDGGRSADVITLVGVDLNGNGSPNGLDVRINDDLGHATLLDVETISVDAGGGNDLVAANALVSNASLVADGGAGDDTVLGSARADTLDGGDGDDRIDGNGGADVMLGGKGDDTLIWDPGDGNDTLDGGAGFDTHVFNTSNAAEELTLFAENSHAILTRNVGTIRMDIDNVERVVIGGGGGADRVTIGDLSRTDVREVSVDLRAVGPDGVATGDGAADTVAVSGGVGADRVQLGVSPGGVVTVGGLSAALSVTQAEAQDRVEFDGGAGADVVAINGGVGADSVVLVGVDLTGNGSPNGLDFNINGDLGHATLLNVETISIDAGSGADLVTATTLVSNASLVADGGDGNDTVLGSARADTLQGGDGDDRIDGNGGADVMLGGKGDDTLIWDPGDGSDTLEGGAGFDTHVFNTAAGAEELALFAEGNHAILTRNVGGIRMDIDTVERVVIGGGGGDDAIRVGDLSKTDIKEVRAEGGAGADSLNASALDGRLDLTLSGGAGSDRFVFSAAAGGTAKIEDFAVHSGGAVDADVIQLLGSSDASFEAALANGHIVQSGADVVISDASGVIVTLQGIQVGALQANDFLFG